MVNDGEVAERSKALDWNSSNILTGVRGFESHPLRHSDRGGPRRFLRDDEPPTPSGPEGSSGNGDVGRRSPAGAGCLHCGHLEGSAPMSIYRARAQMAPAPLRRAGRPGARRARADATRSTAGRVHHAFLFTGTRGVGKTTIARILAKCLNCETRRQRRALRRMRGLPRDRRRPLRRPASKSTPPRAPRSTTRASCSTTCSTRRRAAATRST